MTVLFVYTTFPNTDTAASVAQSLLKKNLIACANLFPSVRSFYVWQGEMRDEDEVVMIMKTTAQRYHAMEQEIVRLHAYDVPCIVALSVEAGHGPYLQWIATETGSEA